MSVTKNEVQNWLQEILTHLNINDERLTVEDIRAIASTLDALADNMTSSSSQLSPSEIIRNAISRAAPRAVRSSIDQHDMFTAVNWKDAGVTSDAAAFEEALNKSAHYISEGPMEQLEGFNKERRFSVSAEPYNPSANRHDASAPVVIPKDDATKEKIRQCVKKNILFRNLDSEQLNQVIDAMFEKKIPRQVEVIRQGDEGDFFYAIDAGRFEVLQEGKGKVVELGPGDSFGELALMYGSPRLATVRALEESVLWAVDRATFRRIVIDLSFAKRKLYESFLRTVPILHTLHDSEIYRICDALQPVSFNDGDLIVKQGEIGHEFYIIEEGSAVVTLHCMDNAGEEVEVAKIGKGDYFGELALLHDAPRAASVTAIGTVKCLLLSKADFIRLLGPVMPILQRNQEHYRKYEEYIQPTMSQ